MQLSATPFNLCSELSPKTDLFTNPENEITLSNSPRLLFTPVGKLQLTAWVAVGVASTFDAGVPLLFANLRNGE